MENMKIRITFFNDFTPENSYEEEVVMSEKGFYMLMEAFRCYYDEEYEMYYSDDDRVGFEITDAHYNTKGE